jgi:hypothetical protein
MITYDEAYEKAWEFIRNIKTNVDVANLVIITDCTKEESFGWVFFWDDKRFVAGDNRFGLCGNLPIVVLRDTGHALFLPHKPWEGDVDASIKAFCAGINREKEKGSGTAKQ